MSIRGVKIGEKFFREAIAFAGLGLQALGVKDGEASPAVVDKAKAL
jgi:hypothetical protein